MSHPIDSDTRIAEALARVKEEESLLNQARKAEAQLFRTIINLLNDFAEINKSVNSRDERARLIQNAIALMVEVRNVSKEGFNLGVRRPQPGDKISPHKQEGLSIIYNGGKNIQGSDRIKAPLAPTFDCYHDGNVWYFRFQIFEGEDSWKPPKLDVQFNYSVRIGVPTFNLSNLSVRGQGKNAVYRNLRGNEKPVVVDYFNSLNESVSTLGTVLRLLDKTA